MINLLFFAFGILTNSQLDKVVGVVGNACITRSELEEMKMMLPNQISDDELLTRLIEQKLLVIQAERDSIIVKDDELARAVEGAILDLKGKFPSDETFNAELEKSGMTEVSLRKKYAEKLKEQLLTQKLFQKKFGKELAVGDVEALEFYQSNKDSIPLQPAGVRLLGISIKYAISEEALKKVDKKAESLLNRAKKGESFSELVKKYSDDEKTKASGGNLGVLNQSDMGEEFHDVVAKLSPGNVGLVKSQFAYHIIKCEAREEEMVKLKDLILFVKPTKSDSAALEKKVTFVKNILDTIKQDSIPEIFKDSTKIALLSWGEAFIPIANTPFASIEKVQLNTVSVFHTPLSVQIIKPVEVREEKISNWEDIRDDLKQFVYQKKLAKHYKQLIDKLKKEIYTKSML
ncbi:MAG: peptidylprolyl isomerase [bacterium]|nr:peptidylprolyl isomerase [bacterium]